jgi:hypothetical protein
VPVIKSRRVRWAGHVTHVGVGRVFCCASLRERYRWGDQGVDGKIMLRRIFRKWDVEVWTGLSWLRIERVGGHM